MKKPTRKPKAVTGSHGKSHGKRPVPETPVPPAPATESPPHERTPTNPKGAGRKSTVSPYAASKLREVFMLDYDVEEACDHAGITSKAYYRRFKKDEKFRGEMEEAQRSLFKSMKRNIATEVIVNKNARLSLDVLKHRQPHRYRTKVDLGGDGEHGASILPAGTVIVLPGDYPHPRIIPESKAPPPESDADEDD